MKVTFATYPWAFETPGGGEIQLLKYEEYLRQENVEVIRHDPWAANIGKTDIFHFFSCIGGSIHLCNYVKSRGIPLVISSSLWITEETRHLYPIDEIRAQLSLADAIVTNGDIESDQIASVVGLPRERFHTIRNACDSWFSQASDPDIFRKKFNISGPFVLNVGNIEPRKNQLNLVRACRKAGLPLILIGHNRDQAYAEACFNEMTEGMHYLGPIDHNDILLRSAFAACSVFCLPSTLETPGLAALEAAAAGAPLVVTGEGSTREYFADLCTYVCHDDAEGIAEALQGAIAHGRSGELREHINARFTWNKVASDLKAFYESLMVKG